MMGKKSLVVVLGMAVLLVGGLLLAGSAGAVTTKTPSVCFGSTGESIVFILGEDQSIWYTLIDTPGAAVTGAFDDLDANISNPFAVATPDNTNLTGFVSTGTFPSGTENAGIWVKIPGAGGFQDAPACVQVITTLGTAAAPPTNIGNENFTIMAPGLDNRVWRTVFDGDNSLTYGDAFTLDSSLIGSLAGSCWRTGTANKDGAVDDGWASAGFITACGNVGAWIPFP